MVNWTTNETQVHKTKKNTQWLHQCQWVARIDPCPLCQQQQQQSRVQQHRLPLYFCRHCCCHLGFAVWIFFVGSIYEWTPNHCCHWCPFHHCHCHDHNTSISLVSPHSNNTHNPAKRTKAPCTTTIVVRRNPNCARLTVPLNLPSYHPPNTIERSRNRPVSNDEKTPSKTTCRPKHHVWESRWN